MELAQIVDSNPTLFEAFRDQVLKKYFKPQGKEGFLERRERTRQQRIQRYA